MSSWRNGWLTVDVSRREEARGWLGTQLSPAPWDDDDAPRGVSPVTIEDFLPDGALCACGAEEHEPCRCNERTAA